MIIDASQAIYKRPGNMPGGNEIGLNSIKIRFPIANNLMGICLYGAVLWKVSLDI